MIELKNDELLIQFPDVHEDAVCRVDFQRTLRIPDDNRDYPLPPGLGRFSVEHVEDHSSRLPAAWVERGGVLLPMYQAEALWINFSSGSSSRRSISYPFALKIAAGKINAVTGDEWTNGLGKDPQDYLVVPDQPWLDGFCVQKGLIRQFVAMPMGAGYTAEEQISGTAAHGGIQIIVYPMKRDRYEKLVNRTTPLFDPDICYSLADPCESVSMGLAPGGLMRQEIYEDKYGYDAWDTSRSSRCFIHILNSAQWEIVTGKSVPRKPPSAADYTKAALPWFEYYDEKLCPLSGVKSLAGLDSIGAKSVKFSEKPLSENAPIPEQKVIQINSPSHQIKEGNW